MSTLLLDRFLLKKGTSSPDWELLRSFMASFLDSLRCRRELETERERFSTDWEGRGLGWGVVQMISIKTTRSRWYGTAVRVARIGLLG